MFAGVVPAIVYALCFATSAACAVLLGRTYRRTRMPLLFWSTICFGLLAGNNLVLILDRLVVTGIDLSLVRISLSLGAVLVLLFGFIWNLGEDR